MRTHPRLAATALIAFALWSAPTIGARAADDQNCSDFPSQAAAQQHLRDDPSDPDGLDGDNDGIACESNPSPYDNQPVDRSGGGGGEAPPPTYPPLTSPPPTSPRPTSPPATSPAATQPASAAPRQGSSSAGDVDCPDFPSQAAAQRHLRADSSDPDRLDADNDGIACETNPAPYDRATDGVSAASTASTSATTSGTRADAVKSISLEEPDETHEASRSSSSREKEEASPAETALGFLFMAALVYGVVRWRRSRRLGDPN